MKFQRKLFLILICCCVLSIGNLSRLQSVPRGGQDSVIVDGFDIAPQFRGGIAGWQRFLQQNMDVSDAVRAMDSTAYVEYGLRQTALMEFTVCENGEVCEIVITNKHTISPEFAKEALRVMRRSPKWTPALRNGAPVRTRIKQSITAILGL